MTVMMALFTGCGTNTSTTTTTEKVTKAEYQQVIAKYKNPNYTLDVKAHAVLDFDLEKFVDLINESRKEGAMCGDHYYAPTTPVIIDGRLVTSSLKKAYDLGTSREFSHDGSGANSDEFKEGVSMHFAKMIRNEMGRTKGVGENIAYGFVDIEALHQAFMESPGHCRNVMNDHFNLVGISAYEDGYGNYYWAEHFSTAK